MRLYDILSEMYSLIDEETGEILDSERFTELLKMKGEKLENAALLIKDVKGDKEKLQQEIKRLQGKVAVLEHTEERVKELIKSVLNGEKFKTSKVSIYYMETDAVEILDPEKIPAEFVKIVKEPMKTEIKKAIKSGTAVDGAQLKKNVSMVIK